MPPADLPALLPALFPTAVVHPSLVVAPDAHGGRGLFLSGPAYADAMLLAVPRAAMLEAATREELAAKLLRGWRFDAYLPGWGEMGFHPQAWDPELPETAAKSDALIEGIGVPDAERHAFRAALLSRLALLRASAVREHAALASPWDPATPPPDLLRFLWAKLMVSTRALHLWAGPALVPLADYMNWAPRASVAVGCEELPPPGTDSESEGDSEDSEGAYFRRFAPRKPDPSRQHLTVRAARDMEAGEELVFQYLSFPVPRGTWEERREGTADWAVGYGFVPRGAGEGEGGEEGG